MRDGRQDSLERIYLDHSKRLKLFVRQLVGCPALTEDIIQEAFLRLRQAEVAGPITHPKPFLYTTARNLAYDKLRQDRRRGRVVDPGGSLAELDEIPTAEPSPQTLLEDRELLQRIESVLASMPERRRRIFTMRRMSEMSVTAIAAELGISESTVRNEIKTALLECFAERNRRR